MNNKGEKTTFLGSYFKLIFELKENKNLKLRRCKNII